MSSGHDNDELVDNLIDSGYIKTKEVEQVFRAVDRADYVLSTYRESAYKDLAWKHGNIHLSAPCIYSEVLEGLCLEPGMSFLNLGSGTGYLSTMAGLLLQQHGTNHGIELHEDCLRYAYERLEEFKQKSLALDEFDFCEPMFIQGNCLSIIPGRQYDRVYCGAACPESHETFIKQFVRVGGILVMPYKDQLLCLKRTEHGWSQHSLLPVSFSTLVVPPPSEQNLLHLPECNPLSLQELCRSKIRHRLRQNIWFEHSNLEVKKRILPIHQRQSAQQRTLSRFVIPIFEESDEALTDDEQDIAGRARLLLNVNSHPVDAITTTLQLVRAVIQPNQNDGEENQRISNEQNERVSSEENQNSNEENQRVPNERGEHASSEENQRVSDEDDRQNDINEDTPQDTATNTSFHEREQKRKFFRRIPLRSNADTDDTDMGHSSSATADVNENNNEERRFVYPDTSDNESDGEQESVFMQREKIAKRKKTDSGIVDDVNLSEEGSSTSSNTNHSDSDITDTTDTGEPMDVDLPDLAVYDSYKSTYSSLRSSPKDSNSRKKFTFGHYVDSDAFALHMRKKIQQLPLPFSIKVYMNYNRKL